MGIQNAEHFERVADVALFRRLGLRCAQLTYNSQNRIGSGSTERCGVLPLRDIFSNP